MRAALDDAAVLDDENLVGVHDRRQAVRDRERRVLARDELQLRDISNL
jgi:hypothetical protein